MKFSRKLSFLPPLVLVAILIALAYGNVVFLGRSLNPVLLIPQREIQLATGFSDIAGNPDGRHGWHVDLANPAYLEWPVNLAIGRSLKAGHIPLVMADQNLGVPLIGQYCHRVLAPYQMIENLFLPAGYDFFILLRLILAGLFTYLFLRPLCRMKISALLAGAGFGLGSIMVIYSNHEEVANVAMLIPLLIWAVRAFFDRPDLGRACWLALALALVHTAGQPEIQLFSLLLALIYGLSRLFALPPGRKKNVFFSSLGAIILSFLIAAPQIILFLFFHQEAWTFHPAGGKLGIQSPITTTNFIFAFFPRLRQTPWPWSYRTANLLWDWVGGYFGFGLLILAGAAARRLRSNRREVLVFGLYFLFILAKNLGWSPAQLLGLLPLFDQTWTPRWSAATWSFSLAVLAGLGLDSLLAPETAPPSPPESARPGRTIALLSNPLITSGLLLLGLILSAIFWWQAGEFWKKAQLRGYVFFHGLLFFFLAGAALLLWRLFSPPVRKYFRGIFQSFREATRRRQFEVIGLLAAAAFAALHWFPARHHHFPLPEPFGSYLLAGPILLAALAGLFIIAAAPVNSGTAAAAAIAIPLALVGGWANLPSGPLASLWGAIFLLDLAAFALLPPKSRWRKILLPTFSALLLAGLAGLFFTASFFSPQADRILRLHFYFAVLALAFFSWLCLRSRRAETRIEVGWFFLLLIWAELAVYIPRNHFDHYHLSGNIPFAIATAVIILALIFRKSAASPLRRRIFFAAGLAAGGVSIIATDLFSFPRLPRRVAPRQPLPFIRHLQQQQPAALVGVGRVLAPNFASAHSLADIRGCVSMNTRRFQFFLDKILQVVPPNSSYSLWFTGDNPVTLSVGTPYGSSQSIHVKAFEQAWDFYRLAGVRYVLSPPGVLDKLPRFPDRPMSRIYGAELDIWEIPALPPAFIAHRAEVISMREETGRWRREVTKREEILRGEVVLLEEDPGNILPPGPPSPGGRAELLTGEDPNRLRVRFYTETPGYLVVNRAHTNLLRAYLAGRELPVLPANGPFFAVPVPGGSRERELEITYFSPPVRWSFYLAAIGLALASAGLAVGRGKRRKGKTRSGGAAAGH